MSAAFSECRPENSGVLISLINLKGAGISILIGLLLLCVRSAQNGWKLLGTEEEFTRILGQLWLDYGESAVPACHIRSISPAIRNPVHGLADRLMDTNSK